MRNFKVEKLDVDILALLNEYEGKLSALKAEKTTAEKLDPEMVLAEELHKRFCPHNHTDGCGFLYGSWETPREEQRKWILKAVRFKKAADLRGVSPEEFLELVDMVK